jgi:hypothetical protein
VLARRDVLAMNLMPSSRDDDLVGCAPVEDLDTRLPVAFVRWLRYLVIPERVTPLGASRLSTL